jgi:hypothetical protein
MTSELITSKNEMYVATLVNRENATTANNFEHTSKKNKDNTPMRVRRSGKTQTWKTRPAEFKIPVKYGLYESGYITQDNCHEWVIS